MAKKSSIFDEQFPDESGGDFLRRKFLERLRNDDTRSPEQKELDDCREMCRNGNPFPLIALQWPELIITDKEEAAIFARSMRIERFERLTDGIKSACFHPKNPPLRLDWWQKIALAAFFDESIAEIGEKGATKVGKGASTAMGINLWFDVWDECKIILTSQRSEHAKQAIFGETARWHSRMSYPSGKLTTEGIKDKTTRYVVIANPDEGEGFSGQHGPRTLFVMDEASAVPDTLYDNATKQMRKLLALSNPRTLSGWFRALYKPCTDENVTQIVNGPYGKRLCMTIDGADCMNVVERRLEKPIGPPGGITIGSRTYEHNELIPKEDMAEVAPLIPEQCDYGRHMGIRMSPDPNHVAVYAHGHFPKEDSQRQVILGSWIDRHAEAWKDSGDTIPVDCFGFDIARSLDGDGTCLAVGGKLGCRAVHKWKYNDTTFHVSEAIRIAYQQYGIDLTLTRNPVCVDMDGLGAGVGDQLRQRGVWVIEFRGNMASGFDPKTYGNMRAEAYSLFGRRLNPDDAWGQEPWAIPYDLHLFEELSAPEKVFSANDALRFRISPKSSTPGHDAEKVISIKEKIGRSPDTGDAVVYLYHAVREMHALDEWIRSFQTRSLVVYPQSKEEITVRRAELQRQKPPERNEMDDVPFDWAQSNGEPRKIIVAMPGEYQREPWWHRYVSDN